MGNLIARRFHAPPDASRTRNAWHIKRDGFKHDVTTVFNCFQRSSNGFPVNVITAWRPAITAAGVKMPELLSRSANCFTFGGLRCNTNAQVLDGDGRPIPGVYAAGETMGLYFGRYTGATSVLRGAVYGRIAGAHAAAHMSHVKNAARRLTPRPNSSGESNG